MRQRAAEGQARRRKMKQSIGKQFVQGAAAVLAMMVFEAGCVSAYAAQGGGAWMRRFYGTGRVDVVEIFGGHSEVSYQFARAGLLASQPYDERYGCNLKCPEQVKKLKEDLDRLQPRLAIVEFPCTRWSTLNNMIYGGDQRKRRILKKLQKEEMPLLWLTKDVFDIQLNRGDDALAENPRGSEARKQTPIKALENHPEVLIAYSHACRFNFRHLKTGKPIYKPTVWWTTSPEMQTELNVRCLGGHQHDVVLGGKNITSHAGCYTPELARAILRGFRATLARKDLGRLSCLRRAAEARVAGRRLQAEPELVESAQKNPKLFENYPVSGKDTEIPSEGMSFSFKEKGEAKACGPALRNCIKHLHVNTGHARPDDLARIIKLVGGSDAAVTAARVLRCSTCEAHRRPDAARPSRIKPQDLEFNEVVLGDLYWLPNAKGERKWFFMMVDNATDYCTIELMDRHTSEELWAAYEKMWLIWAGPPDKLVVDNEGGLISDRFVKMLAHSGTECCPPAPYAPWQKGQVERKIRHAKEIQKKGISHLNITADDEMQLLGYETAGGIIIIQVGRATRHRCGSSVRE